MPVISQSCRPVGDGVARLSELTDMKEDYKAWNGEVHHHHKRITLGSEVLKEGGDRGAHS